MTIDEFIRSAVHEDIGDGDHTSDACIPTDAEGRARMLVKESGVIAGVHIAEQIFYYIDSSLKVKIKVEDGTPVEAGDVVMKVSGKARSILKAERLALNCMQRMSGIATKTRQVIDSLQGLNTKVLDTRKTTPGIRFLEKLAVKIGGGVNHRFGLYDMMMIKDNHIDFAGGIENAIHKANDYLKKENINIKIEIEVRDFEELDQVLSIGKVDRIMLDNFSPSNLSKAIQIIDHQFETEASGGITIDTIVPYAETGVDYISMGALTHSAQNFDISMVAV